MENLSFIDKKMKDLGLMMNSDRLLTDFQNTEIEHRWDVRSSDRRSSKKIFLLTTVIIIALSETITQFMKNRLFSLENKLPHDYFSSGYLCGGCIM